MLKNSVAKILASITYDCSRSTKMSKDSVLQKLDHNFVVIDLSCTHLHPFGHVVHNNKNVEVAKGVWEESHKVNVPHIKNFNNQNAIEGHHISS
jgi:hypothetical protein